MAGASDEVRRGRLTKAWGSFVKGDLLTDSQVAADEKGSELIFVDPARFKALVSYGFLKVLEPGHLAPKPELWELKVSPSAYLKQHPDGPAAVLAKGLIDGWSLRSEPADYLVKHPEGPHSALARVLTGTHAAAIAVAPPPPEPPPPMKPAKASKSTPTEAEG